MGSPWYFTEQEMRDNPDIFEEIPKETWPELDRVHPYFCKCHLGVVVGCKSADEVERVFDAIRAMLESKRRP